MCDRKFESGMNCLTGLDRGRQVATGNHIETWDRALTMPHRRSVSVAAR
jgi:hypothetical protein